MRIQRDAGALSLVLALLACAAVQGERPGVAAPRESAPVEPAEPLASFARLVPGEWRVAFQSGTSQFDRWQWGPGRRSLLSQTYGADAGGAPWRELQVVYWHPAREQVRLLALRPRIPNFGHGVAEGALTFDGDTLEARFDLHQPGHPHRAVRALRSRWVFDGPDAYRETLSEDGGGGFGVLAEWDYARATALSALPLVADAAARPSEHLAVFAALVGRPWEAEGERPGGGALHLRSTFEWLPYVAAVHARTVTPGEDGAPEPLLDAYVYLHPGAGALRCLALSRWGGVYEGDLTVLAGGALQLDLTGHADERAVPHAVRFDLEADGSLRQRIWSSADGERALLLDLRHERVEPKDG